MIQITVVGAAIAALGAGPQAPPAVVAEPAAPLTLAAALAAAEHAPVARVIALDLEQSRAEADQAGLWPNPELSIWREEAAGVVEGFAQASIPLPVSGRLDLERRAATSSRAAAEARAGQAGRLVQARVREAFIALLAAQRRHDVLAQSAVQVEALVATLSAREAAGEASGFDRMRAARQLALLRARLGGAVAERERERLALAALLGLPATGLVLDGDLGASTPTLPSIEEARRLAVERPDLGALDLEATSADLLAEAAGRRGIPEPTLSVGAEISALGEDDIGPVIGLSLALPFADRGRASQRAATAKAAALRGERAQRQAAAAAEAEGALLMVGAARTAEAALHAGVENDPVVPIATALYDAGEISVHDLLDAHVSTLELELALIEASRTARLAEVELDRILGLEVTP